MLKGKNVLIVGATGGIGSRAAKLISGSGAVVYITGRNIEKLLQVAGEAGIPQDRTFQMDITDELSVNDTVQKIVALSFSY